MNRITPVYLFNGGGAPDPGENYRAALARLVTSDFQFARASVNYIWEHFFGIGLVNPSDQFDPARLDPDNPPPDPWTLQPSNARLLNALAQDFIDSKYDLKALMREIVNSQAYQLSARYDEKTWNPLWENLFARKFVRRLWAEEIHDAIAQSSNLIPSYAVNGIGTVSWAMQFPETFGSRWRSRRAAQHTDQRSVAHLLRMARWRRIWRRDCGLPLTETRGDKMRKRNSDLLPAIHPGEILTEEFMKPLGLSINRVARDLRVPVTRISEIANRRRSVSVDTAPTAGAIFRHDA